VAGASLGADGKTAQEDDDEDHRAEGSHSDHHNQGTFQVVGTVTCKSETKRPHVLEEYHVSRNNLLIQDYSVYHVLKRCQEDSNNLIVWPREDFIYFMNIKICSVCVCMCVHASN